MLLKEWKVVRRYATGGRVLLGAEDVEFDIYKRASKFMELSCLKILPEQEVQAGGVYLWQLRRQANSFSIGFVVLEFQCPLRLMCKMQRLIAHCRGSGFYAARAEWMLSMVTGHMIYVTRGRAGSYPRHSACSMA